MSLKQENLISTSVQYKVGQRLVKVGNSFVPVGFGGNFEPGKGGSTPEEPEEPKKEMPTDGLAAEEVEDLYEKAKLPVG